ncbi:MAG: SpoVG family protein [Tyzzerella sp.]|nr:SpoVG family protein [Tyzzerella sp.]
MNYTVQVNEVKNTDGNIRAFANVVFGECFKITNIAILENKEKGQLFVSMPRYKSSQRNKDNEPVYKDVCNPITKEFREELYSHILEEYQYVMDRRKGKVTENVSVDKADGKSKEDLQFSVSVTTLERDGSDVRGLARIFLEDCFVINNVTIIQGKENLFVAMPSYKTKDVDENNKPVYRDICYPVTKEFREKLYGTILETHQMEQKSDFRRRVKRL